MVDTNIQTQRNNDAMFYVFTVASNQHWLHELYLRGGQVHTNSYLQALFFLYIVIKVHLSKIKKTHPTLSGPHSVHVCLLLQLVWARHGQFCPTLVINASSVPVLFRQRQCSITSKQYSAEQKPNVLESRALTKINITVQWETSVNI